MSISSARKKGERAAQSVLDRLPSLSAPIPVKEIAISEGCVLNSTLLDDELSGMAFIKSGQKHIVYNATHHPNRQRFTIAHELGHHIMDERMLRTSVHVDKGVLRRDNLAAGGVDIIEIAANAFAACILMPSYLVRAACPPNLDLEDEDTVRALARKFSVSQAAFTNRVLNLSI